MGTRINTTILVRAGLAALVLAHAAGAAMAQSTVTLTAAPATVTLPDGQSVPMWGYACGAVSGAGASCSAMNATGSAWKPPLIRVPAGQLTVTLVNNLQVPTSIVVDGQVGGGLGDAPTRMASPAHPPQGTTWPGTLGTTDAVGITGVNVINGGSGYTSAPNVTVTGVGGSGATATATVDASGAVTGITVANGAGYTSATITIDPPASGTTAIATAVIDQSSSGNADSPTFRPPPQADRVRSFATEVAPGATNAALTWNNLRPGTYLLHSGTEPSIQHAMGLYGVLVVTEATASTAYGASFDADVPLLLSEIDPEQNAAVATAVASANFNERATYAGPGACRDPDTGAPSTTIACYPPAVNYSPRYYLINGTSFNRGNLSASTLPGPGAEATTGNVLLRIVNAGQRMHAPAVVGANMTLLAEDGNKVSKATGVQASIPMPPGKTFDALIAPTRSGSTYTPATYAVFDRQLSLSTNNQRDGGMQAYIAVAGGASSGTGSPASAVTAKANPDAYSVVPGATLTVGDASKGLMANDTGVYGVRLDGTAPTAGTLTLHANGTFTYASDAGLSGPLTFSYCANNAPSGDANLCATVTISVAAAAAAPVANALTFDSTVASRFASPPPGLFSGVTNPSGLALTANPPAGVANGTVTVNADGSFVATPSCTAPCSVTFQYSVKNAQGTASNTALATVNFAKGSGLALTVRDGPTGAAISDYRWIIEEDRTFWIDPKCQVNSTDPAVRPATCPPLPVESSGYNFHTASMPVIAAGCVGTVSCEAGQKLQGADAVCDVGNGGCRTGASQKTPVSPGDVALDPNKRYFLSILPGDAINPTISGFAGTVQECGTFDATGPNWKLYDPASGTSGNCGHEMGGVQLPPGATAATINLQQIPLPTAKISVFVFQDDNPLNGENDAGGGVDVIAPNEAGLGGFEVKLFDQAGQLGDATGQITYDEFNEPVSNSLAGYIDPVTGLDACPISTRKDALVGMIPTCPKYESDGVTPSPLAGQVVIDRLYPGLYEIQAYPAADRIARGEEWLQTNTLDGGKPHEAFIKPNEPGYFQEFGPGGYHVAIGFANPANINARKAGYCASALNPGGAAACSNTLVVEVTNNHMSRTPDERTFDSESYDHYSFTQCYVSIGVADAEDFAIQPCVLTTGADGKTHATATFTGMPAGTFKMSVFDQWNDIMLDGLVGTVEIGAGGTTVKKFPVTQWRTNLYTRTYIDTDNSGVSSDDKPGLALVNTNIRYRDGSIGFFNNTDMNGYAAWNEVFPLMNWLVVETTQTRFKPTWIHSVYDAGGPVDCSSEAKDLDGNPLCSQIAANLANTNVRVPLPADLRVPGAKYCDSADCPPNDALQGKSTGALFPPQAFGNTMGWQGLLGQDTFIEFGVKPFKKADGNAPAENGGIHGQVVYSSTRPFDDPTLLLQLSWEPGIPHATINLYRKELDAQGNETLKLVDTTKSASWDDWAQGFRAGADGTTLLTAGTGANAGFVPNMNCPGQASDSPFFTTLKNSKMWLDTPDAGGNKKALAYQSQFKCYDGWSQLNQAQPAPYDGYYSFPSITATDATGKPVKTNCTACIANPDDGNPMLPSGTYVVEVIVPPGYELVKEEDKNILLGDVYVAPVTQQFAGVGNIFIMPDQAEVNSAYNAANPGGLNRTVDLGAKPRHEGDTGSIEAFWPCVGAQRQVPDFNSEFPGAQQAAPFAGAIRRLCDRKEIKLADEASAVAKFFLFSDTHIAGHMTGVITNDFASEFDPFSPQFGEKFGPPNLPVGLRDFNGGEVARVYSDQWGIYNGLYFSTWSPNPPNPTGYAPQMSIACMNDPGPIMVDGVMTTDPSYNPAYSNFCYEQPFMPGTTTYMDTPVVPTQSFADGYNLPDTEYPDQTPAIRTVVNANASEPQGPWVHAGAMGIQITALGDKTIQNPHFAGPNATTAPYNQKTITRHYGFGSGGTAVLVAPDGTTTAPLTVTSWSDMAITATVPALSAAFNCKMQQAGVSPPAQCGQLVITRNDNGKRSIDAITVTVGGTAPWIVTEQGVTAPSGKTVNDYGSAFGRMALVPGAVNQSPIQVAIDSASPGDLILVQPGTYRENLIMWKPLRLQGVGAGAVTVNADAHPAGHMEQWRRQMVCVFGLDLNGVPNIGNDPGKFDPSGQYKCPDEMFLTGDRIPFEAITGWQATGNGNLAQVLQEPTLLGAYEGAGITVVGRGVRVPTNDPFFLGNDPAQAGAFSDGSVYLTDGSTGIGNLPANADDCVVHTGDVAKRGGNYGTSNYRCNPSRIDGLSILNSSQGGGGLFIHGWAHNLEVANNRISANHGTLAGAINLGNGETPPVFLNDGTICNAGLNPAPLCPPMAANTPSGATIPFGFNTDVRIHHNMLWNNASIGDALFTGTPSGAGGVTVSAGGDRYSIDHNWIAGNLSTGDGGGLQSLGVSFNGKIANNVILFNQSTNPTLPTNGGGIVVQGANEPRTLNGNECGATTDADCPPGLGDGTGAGLVIDANLIYGNSAESGTGGGVALEQINGSEVIAFPRDPDNWYGVTLTNNIIANNVAGYDGGGVSMRDALKVKLINNTIASNDTTASAGVLFKTLGAINASNPPPGCNAQTDPTLPQDPSCLGRDAPHGPQPSGLVTMAHTQNLFNAIATLAGNGNGVRMTCPSGFGYTNGNGNSVNDADCMTFSRPVLVNDMFWQNRTFHVNLVAQGTGLISQQNLVVIAPGAASNSTPLPAQTASGQCPTGASYWDVGLRTDDVQSLLLSPTNNKLVITNSILTGTGDISNLNDVVASSTNRVGVANPVNAQICNGARVPPELCGSGGDTGLSGAASCRGMNAPPGASETTSTSQLFVFDGIHPTATVDEGHNWLNLVYGPLTLARPGALAPTAGEQMLTVASTALDNGAYSIPGNSPAIGGGVPQAGNDHDFFGNSRATNGKVNIAIGAVERQASTSGPASALVSANPLTITITAPATSGTGTLTLTNTSPAGGPQMTVSSVAVAGSGGGNGNNAWSFTKGQDNCTGATVAAGGSCTVDVVFNSQSAGTRSGTITFTDTAAGSPQVFSVTGVRN